MNYKLIFSTVLKVIKLQAVLMLIPLITCLIYNELAVFYSFLITLSVAYAFCAIAGYFFKGFSKDFYAKDGLVTVAFSWLAVSIIGAIPFYISGEIPSFIDALFESISGFTTTGASIIKDVESLSKGLIIWRALSHFVGGMGVLVFIMAITSKTPDRPINILKAEMPGPIVSKLVPSSKDTAKILYLIYLILTVLLVILLAFGGMDTFDSIVHALSTAGTGGFSSKNDSLMGYNSYIQWVIIVFMILFGVNFNVFYLIIIKKIGVALKSSELRTYLFIVLASSITIFLNVYSIYGNVEETIRTSLFQTTSMMSTTGFATVDYNDWPILSKIVLFSLMIIGGCSGSTAGGLKVSRVVIIFKKIKITLKKLIHPNSVSVVKFEGDKVKEEITSQITAYVTLYAICFFAICLLLAFNNLDFETIFSSATACFNNVGPGFNLAGPTTCYADFSWFSKIVLSVAMLLGRLEIYPLLLILMPSTWRK